MTDLETASGILRHRRLARRLVPSLQHCSHPADPMGELVARRRGRVISSVV